MYRGAVRMYWYASMIVGYCNRKMLQACCLRLLSLSLVACCLRLQATDKQARDKARVLRCACDQSNQSSEQLQDPNSK